MTQPASEIVEELTRWACKRPDVIAVALVGSHARGEPGPDSDVDVLLISANPAAYEESDAWIAGTPCRERAYVRRWGRLTEHRLLMDDGPEVELGVVGAEWATDRPVDPGTHRVVSDGMVVLHDPEGILGALSRAVVG